MWFCCCLCASPPPCFWCLFLFARGRWWGEKKQETRNIGCRYKIAEWEQYHPAGSNEWHQNLYLSLPAVTISINRIGHGAVEWGKSNCARLKFYCLINECNKKWWGFLRAQVSLGRSPYRPLRSVRRRTDIYTVRLSAVVVLRCHLVPVNKRSNCYTTCSNHAVFQLGEQVPMYAYMIIMVSKCREYKSCGIGATDHCGITEAGRHWNAGHALGLPICRQSSTEQELH